MPMNIRWVVGVFWKTFPPILLTTQVHLSNCFLGNYNVWIPQAKQTRKNPDKTPKQTNNKPKSTALPKLKEIFQYEKPYQNLLMNLQIKFMSFG